VALREGSLLRSVIGEASYVTPSMHHQAVNQVGPNLVATGSAPDSVVEVIEHSDPKVFVIGVQGDIERARRNWNGFDRLYLRFVEECRGRRTN
jgi:putative glutamine amidotransferase